MAATIGRAERDEALVELDDLAERIASAWRSPKSAVGHGRSPARGGVI